jgi:hypothetical protein
MGHLHHGRGARWAAGRLAAAWRPGGPPCFVERYENLGLIKGVRPNVTRLTYNAARERPGQGRMETPVVYFYSPADVSVDVIVEFPMDS